MARRPRKSPVFVSPATRQRRLIDRLIAIQEAGDALLPFVKFTMPDPDDVDDTSRSLYTDAKHHRLIAAALEEVEKGTWKRLIINCPPRHGKTELASKKFIPWYSGRHPEHSIIFGTYNEKYAGDIGRAVRDAIKSPAYAQVFPDYGLKEGSAATDRLETLLSGVLAFVGRGGTATGRGGHLLVIDDPLKDRAEANSPTIRDQLWTWFTQVILSRAMTKDARVVIIQTRWHEDDLVGRLTDPSNDYFDEEEAKKWKIIDLPALAMEDDPLGRKPGEALWPERFDEDFLLGMQRVDARGFSSLYQGRPTPQGGAFFREEWLKTYKPSELPKQLRFYCASDHAVSTTQDRDKTVLLPVGVDPKGDIYVMPDAWIRHANAEQTVEAMLTIMRKYKPQFWWAERSHITKSLGPFLRRRMREENVNCAVVDVIPISDKQTRAQSIQGRIAMGRVFFPERAVWWPEARDELIRFPNAAHDDFVDALAWIGLGVDRLHVASLGIAAPNKPKPQTFGAMIADSNRERRQARLAIETGGW